MVLHCNNAWVLLHLKDAGGMAKSVDSEEQSDLGLQFSLVFRIFADDI